MPNDRVRRLLCLLLPFAQVLVALLPVLGIGQSIGVMSAASQTPAIPAGYAFPMMWTLLFLLSVAFGIWQFLPAQEHDPLARRAGWPLAGVFAANTLWMVVAIFSSRNGFGLVVVILAGLACALLAAFLVRSVPAGRIGGWIVRPLTGLMAGWLSAAAFANLSGAARAAGMVEPDGFGATLVACLIVLAAGGFAAAVAWLLHGARWYAAGVGWALVAVVLANLGINQFNLPVAAVAAAMLAMVVALSWSRSRTAPRVAGA